MEQLLQQKNLIEMKNNCIHFMFAYQKKEVERMLSFCDPEGEVYFVPLGEEGKGKIGVLGKHIWTSLIDSFPDINNTVDAIVSEGDSIRCQVLISGTQVKDFAGIENKGNDFESDHIFIFHLNDQQKIDCLQVQWDHADFVRQLQG